MVFSVGLIDEILDKPLLSEKTQMDADKRTMPTRLNLQAASSVRVWWAT
jgi:hypothetical protein